MKTEQQLDQAIAQLTAEIAPQRDLWPDLLTKLDNTEQAVSTRKPYWLMIAACGVFTVLGWSLFSSYSAPVLSAEVRLIQHFEQQKAQQLAAMTRVSGEFSDWSQQLAIFEQAVRQVRMALSFYPDEPQLLEQLQQLYQQELAYLALVTTSDTLFN